MSISLRRLTLTLIVAAAWAVVPAAAAAGPCFLGLGSEGAGVGIGDDLESGDDASQFWCRERGDCGGVYADLRQGPVDGYSCQPVTRAEMASLA